jgi:hypothetical protein
MSVRTSYAPGTPSWVDIATDLEAAIPFYTQLFGWTSVSLGEDAGGYGFFLKDGKQAAGFGPQNPGPPVWQSYVTMADVDATAAAVAAAGGAVVVPPTDVMTAGRMAVCSDPQGGFFSLWQPIDNIGSEIVNEPGAFCWNELNSRDVDGSKAFDDCDAAVARAQELGGTSMMPPMEVPAGRFALLQDPQGAVFAVIRLSVET